MPQMPEYDRVEALSEVDVRYYTGESLEGEPQLTFALDIAEDGAPPLYFPFMYVTEHAEAGIRVKIPAPTPVVVMQACFKVAADWAVALSELNEEQTGTVVYEWPQSDV